MKYYDKLQPSINECPATSVQVYDPQGDTKTYDKSGVVGLSVLTISVISVLCKIEVQCDENKGKNQVEGQAEVFDEKATNRIKFYLIKKSGVL